MADNRTMAQMLQAPIEDGEARDWLDKEPPRSILTWDDLVSKFINQFFPPSKTTYLRYKIITFYQEPNETFNEAWERFKELLRQCPQHGFSELHQLDMFYNSLNTNDQDALDSAAGGNFLDKMPRERFFSRNHESFMQNDHNNSTASTSRSGTLRSQTITNPREHVNAITTRSGKTCEGPSTPLVPTPDIFLSFKRTPEQTETSTEKCKIQFGKFPQRPNSYPSKLPYPERMKVRENDKPIQTMVKLVARNKVSSRQFASPTVNAKCSAIIMKKVPEKLKDPGKFLIPCVLQELNRTSALDDSGASFNFYSHSIYKPLGLFDPFSGITTTLFYDPSPSSSPVKTSDNFEKFAEKLAPLDSLPPGNDNSTLKKDLHEENFQDHSNPLFEFDDNFKSSTINPLFDEMEEDVEIKNSNVSDEPKFIHNFEEGYFDSEKDIIFLDNLLSDDTTHNLASEVISDHEPEQNESSIMFSPRSDPLHHEFAGELLTLPSRNDREFREYLSLMTVLCEISTSRSQENVHANQSVENDDSEDEDNELPNLDHQDDPSIPRPPPEPPDVEKCLQKSTRLFHWKFMRLDYYSPDGVVSKDLSTYDDDGGDAYEKKSFMGQ
ncbi:reverse transcriptase domain-containing protein [Tanacetum coccineum]